MKLHRKLISVALDNVHLIDSRQHYKHFSFIVKRNKILSLGVNKGFKTTPLSVKFKWRFSSIHSEVDAVKKFPYSPEYLAGCRLYNLRLTKNGKLAMSRPCKSCLHFLSGFHWDDIIYSDEYGTFQSL